VIHTDVDQISASDIGTDNLIHDARRLVAATVSHHARWHTGDGRVGRIIKNEGVYDPILDAVGHRHALVMIVFRRM